MSADVHLSPSQFGFVHHPENEWEKALMSAPEKSSGSGRLNLQNTELHTGQRGIFPDRVQEYVDRPGLASDTTKNSTPVEVYYHDNKVWAGEGHHRIAAAKQRGQKTMRVARYGHPKDSTYGD